MSTDDASGFPRDFPLLGNRYRRKSHWSDQYNCIAWAAGECHRPWWPGGAPEVYWPPNLPQDETLENFIDAFRQLGYEVCVGAHHECRFEKVAIYVDRRGVPTHAARQLWHGSWISKLGPNVDIRHQTLDVLEGGLYGTVAQVMKRSWTTRNLVKALILSVRTSSILRRLP